MLVFKDTPIEKVRLRRLNAQAVAETVSEEMDEDTLEQVDPGLLAHDQTIQRAWSAKK
jgi:hypothetical protein